MKGPYIIVDLSAEYVAGAVRPADDATDARWFSRADLASEPDVVPKTRELIQRLLAEVM